MDFTAFDNAGAALFMLLEPQRLLYLLLGVFAGLFLGVLPGIGGIVGMALLIPFTYSMDPFAAFACLLGMVSAVSTSDTIPAIMLGIPGSAGSQATILDGPAMAQRGEVTRALSASYASSLIGGVIGALLLGLLIPLLQPFLLSFGSPELLSLSIFGLTMVATLSSGNPLRALAVGALGILLAMIGSEPLTGSLRWTMDSLYLWDGLPLTPLVLGFFALPEMCDLLRRRRSIAPENAAAHRSGIRQGLHDAFGNLWLILRCSWIGAYIGALPGLGSSVVDWLAYGHAKRTEKGAMESFGHGDVRGVIAPESANNAICAGSLLPTLAFGVPGSASMALLLVALQMQGLVAGPQMLAENAPVAYAMVWTIVIANVIAAGTCLFFSNRIARVATLRLTLLMPFVLVVILLGAYQGSNHWGDFVVLFLAGIVGWFMKQLGWPRPPLILGFVLGGLIERYLHISIDRYQFEWLSRPLVLILLSLALVGLVRSILREAAPGARLPVGHAVNARWLFVGNLLLHGFFIITGAVLLLTALTFSPQAASMPVLAGSAFLILLTVSLIRLLLSQWRQSAAPEVISTGQAEAVSYSPLRFAAWLTGLLLAIAVVGILPAIMLFTVCFMRVENNESWPLVLSYAVLLSTFVYVIFGRILATPFPASLLQGVMT